MTAAPFKTQISSQLLLLQVLESSATEIDSGAVVRAPLGNGGKSEKGEQTVGGEGRGSVQTAMQSTLALASKSDTAITEMNPKS